MTKEYILEVFKNINLMYNNPNMYDSLERMLDELIEEIKEKTKWIPCTERLPDYDKDVLLTYAYDGSVFIGHLYQAIEYKTTGFRTFEKIYVDQWVVEYEGYTHDFNAVSAWAELPEGYKKGGDSE